MPEFFLLGSPPIVRLIQACATQKGISSTPKLGEFQSIYFATQPGIALGSPLGHREYWSTNCASGSWPYRVPSLYPLQGTRYCPPASSALCSTHSCLGYQQPRLQWNWFQPPPSAGWNHCLSHSLGSQPPAMVHVPSSTFKAQREPVPLLSVDTRVPGPPTLLRRAALFMSTSPYRTLTRAWFSYTSPPEQGMVKIKPKRHKLNYQQDLLTSTLSVSRVGGIIPSVR